MKNAVFTIVAKNYIGLAQILEKSIRQYYQEFDFYIIVADEISEADITLPKTCKIAKNVLDFSEEEWKDISFKYNITELCTAIKPASFQYLFSAYNYDKLIYLDPDIYFFNSINYVFDNLNTHSIILTPHISECEEIYTGIVKEGSILGTGTFNLGFLALRKSLEADKMLMWWRNRLLTKCYVDFQDGYFVDQNWMNFLPCFFDQQTLFVERNLGLNIAPWNYHERKIIERDHSFFVTNRNTEHSTAEVPIVFVHFSGYDYSKLKNEEVIHRDAWKVNELNDIELLTRTYAKAISSQKELFDQFITLPYSYNFFDNGISINQFHRRLYRGLIEHGEYYSSPFSVGKDSFYSLLRKKKLIKPSTINVDKINKNNIENISSQTAKINFLFSFCFKILGYKKYSLLIRFLRHYARFETQIFLLRRKYIKTNMFR